MAGDHGYLKIDPAFERWNAMRENAYKHFRFTTQTTRAAIIGLVIVPGALFWMASKTDSRWALRASQKGQPLTRGVPPPEEASDS